MSKTYTTAQDVINVMRAQAMSDIATKPEPKGQKFPIGTRIRIADDLGTPMSHFPKELDATVKYTYAHAFGGKDVKSYCLDIDGYGQVAWYFEHQLTEITPEKNDETICCRLYELF